MNFSSNIKYLRKLKKFTQGELAGELALKNTAISNWEQGISIPDVSIALKLSNYFGISVNDLFSEDLNKGNYQGTHKSEPNTKVIQTDVSLTSCEMCAQKDETIEVLKILTRTQQKQVDLLTYRVEDLEAQLGQKKKAG